MVDLTVTLYGVPEEGYPWSSALEDPSIVPPYSGRPSVVLAAADCEPLGNIIDRAGTHFGISPPTSGTGGQDYNTLSQLLGYTAFYRRGEETGVPAYLRTLTTVDPDGRARFAVPWPQVLYGDLARASQLGLLDGNVRRPYLFLPTAFGDFAGYDWQEVLAALGVLWQAIQHAATALGFASGIHWSKGLLESLRRRTERRAELLQKYGPLWRDRNAAPADLDRLLSLRAWQAHEIAGLLGCPLGDAEAILWALGASYNHADGRWYMERTPEDKLIHGDLLIAVWGNLLSQPTDEARRTAEGRLRKYLETGQAPRLPWEL